MKLRPFFTYFGGKYRAAPHYPAPRESTLVEPFAGSAGYALRYPTLKVRLVDLDPIIVGVWDFLIRATRDDILRLPINVAHVDEIVGPQEARWLIGFWFNKGAAAPMKSPSAWMRGCNLPEPKRYASGRAPGPGNFWGDAIRARIADQVGEIKHWRVALASYADIPSVRATWFVDPPYEKAGRAYRMSSHGLNFDHLSSWCRAREGQVIVCENAGAYWLPFRPFRSIKANSGAQKSSAISHEVIWTNEGGHDEATCFD